MAKQAQDFADRECGQLEDATVCGFMAHVLRAGSEAGW